MRKWNLFSFFSVFTGGSNPRISRQRWPKQSSGTRPAWGRSQQHRSEMDRSKHCHTINRDFGNRSHHQAKLLCYSNRKFLYVPHYSILTYFNLFWLVFQFSVFIFFVMCFGIAAAVAVGNNYNLFLSLFRAEHYRDDGFQNEFLRYRVDLERWRIGRNLFGLYYDLTVSLAFFEALSFVSSLMLCYMLYIIGEGPSFFGFRFGYTSGDVTPAKRSTVQSLSTLT